VDLPLWLETSAYTLLAILMGVQIWLWILWAKKPNLEGWKKRHPVIYYFIKTMDHIEEGSAGLKDPKVFLWLVFVGILIWVCQAAMLRFVELAYGVSLNWPATLFVIVAINLAIVLPSAPGSIGTFQFAAILASTCRGRPGHGPRDRDLLPLLHGPHYLSGYFISAGEFVSRTWIEARKMTWKKHCPSHQSRK
jgi:uncharacterized membrane protein YbhN (UPF0104 family)